MEIDQANATRCQGRAGTYEAWYVTFSEPKRRVGYWFRYTTFHPAPGVETEAHSALWAFRFDHDDPSRNWAAKATFPLDALQVQRRPFVLRLEDALLVHNGCSGEFETERGRVSWDLRWDSREVPFPFMRGPWHTLSSVSNIAVQPAIKIYGTVAIDGDAVHLEHVPGGQQHTWGSSHALEWNWGFASGDDFWVDGATSRVRSRFGRELIGTAVGAHARDHRFLFNGPIHVLRAHGPIAVEAWTAEVSLGSRHLHVDIRPRRSDLIGVTYSDPRGGTRVCYHTEVADIELRLTQGDDILARIRRPAAAAFEYASESPLQGLPVLF